MKLIRNAFMLCLLLPFQAAMATTDVLYLVDGDGGTIRAVQGNTVIDENNSLPSQFDPGPTHYAISVRDTIWLASYHPGEPGRLELDLALDETGASGSVVLIPTENETIDGATDGTYNYTIDDFTGVVYQYNSDWSGNPIALFTATCGGSFCPGITWDADDGHFWIADNSQIHAYTLAGDLLGSFSHGAGAAGLAYEVSSNTLWLADNNGFTLRQFSKAGDLLDTVVTSSSFGNNVWGVEFGAAVAPPTPVPGLGRSGIALLTWVMLMTGAFAVRRLV